MEAQTQLAVASTGVEILHPSNEAEWHAMRAQDITSSEVAALFGLSPYITLFELWHRKREELVVSDSSPPEFVRWGNRLESAIAHGIAEDKGWKIRPMKEYMRHTERRMGSSFDFSIGEEGILEVKNVFGTKFRDEWIVEDGEVEAPPHIELQVQHQLGLSRRKFACIGALVGGNRVELIEREPEHEVIARIFAAIDAFWQSIRENRPPSPNFNEDAAFLARVYRMSREGAILDAKGNKDIERLVSAYRDAQIDEKCASERKSATKAELLTLIGDAEKVIGDDFSISAKTVREVEVAACVRSAYRGFRVNWRKNV